MAYILTIILVQAVSQGDINVWQSVLTFVMQMSIGAVAGYLLGRFAVYVLNHINLNNKSLYSVLLLALVYLIFSLTDLVHGNGYLAVYIAGLVVGNHKIVFQKSLTTFFDGYTWLFQIVMFISLGLLVNPHEMLDVVETGLLVGVFMILVARPVSVFLCLAPFRKITVKGKLYVSWVGSRSHHLRHLPARGRAGKCGDDIQYGLFHHHRVAAGTGYYGEFHGQRAGSLHGARGGQFRY